MQIKGFQEDMPNFLQFQLFLDQSNLHKHQLVMQRPILISVHMIDLMF